MGKVIAEMQIEWVNMDLLDTKTIRLQWPPGYEPDFKTGQFITLFWPDTPTSAPASKTSVPTLN